MLIYLAEFFACIVLCYGQGDLNSENDQLSAITSFIEPIGNFSIELMYREMESSEENLFLSTYGTWSALATMLELSLRKTATQIRTALRVLTNKQRLREEYARLRQDLALNTTTVRLDTHNILLNFHPFFILEREAVADARRYYGINVGRISATNDSCNSVNQEISRMTNGRINKVIDEIDSRGASIILITTSYFRGEWRAPFDAWSTSKQPFYSSAGVKTGEVNMMFSQYTYPLVTIDELQATVVELPYNVENRLSMFIMLPNQGVTLKDMFLKFALVTIGGILDVFRSQEYVDHVNCFIPRFKTYSYLDLTDNLKTNFDIYDLFRPGKAYLQARGLPYVSKFIHRAEIEIAEGASGIATEYGKKTNVTRFEANRPFSFFILEKTTTTVLFGGVYRRPILY